MPSSFSRFLSDEELMRVRQLYLESLRQEGVEGPRPADTPSEEPAGVDPSDDES
jgi:hypothetical protein